MIGQLITAALGVWLMFSPAVLGYPTGMIEDNHRIIGPLLISFAVVAAWEICRSLRWVNIFLGGWLVLSLLFFNHPVDAALSAAFTGLGAIIASSFPGTVDSPTGGTWRDLLSSEPHPSQRKEAWKDHAA